MSIVEQLRTILAGRHTSLVHIVPRKSAAADAGEAADAALSDLGPSDLGPSDLDPSDLGLAATSPRTWLPIDAARAEQALANLLEREQAYGESLVPAEQARAAASAWLSRWPDAKVITNATFEDQDGRLTATSCHGFVTNTTFDTGFAVVSADEIGLLFVGDED